MSADNPADCPSSRVTVICRTRFVSYLRDGCQLYGFAIIGLGEWYSPVVPGTGLHPRPSSASTLKQWLPAIDPAGWSTTWYPSRRGEDVEEIHDRVDGYLSVFIPHLERVYPQHKVIMLVSHAATTIALVRTLLGDRNFALRVGCCSLSEFVRKEAEDWKVVGGWEAKKLADGEHLKDGAQRDWGFEDIKIANGKVITGMKSFLAHALISPSGYL